MPRITFGAGLDVYAFIDSDSDEAKGFTTYLGYWNGLAQYISGSYGREPAPAIVGEVRARKPVRKLTAKRFMGDEDELAKILLNGWAQEAGLYAVDDDDPRLMLQNLWNNVQAYYASSAAARAFLLVYGGQVPTTHARTLRAVGSVVTETRLLPEPWNLACQGESPLIYGGFPTEPGDCHNLESGADPADVVAKALKTTRRRDLDERVAQRKEELRVDRAPRGLRRQLDRDTRATTTFDFLWRNRTRSNYGDPSMFYVGSLSQQRSREYVDSVRTVTSATMLVFETMVAQRAPQTLIDTAVHFMSRDRSQISDLVLGWRMRALGLLNDHTTDDDGEPF